MIHKHPTISTQIVRHIRDCLELAGVQSAALLEQHGIAPGSVDDRDHVISLADYVRFFEAAAVASKNSHFGMHAARVMSADGLGPLSFLFLSAPTLKEAFQTFAVYLDAMQEATFMAFIVESSTSHLTYGIRDNALNPRRQDNEYSLGVMCNLLRQYLGRQFAPAEVHFEHERVGSLSWYEKYFDCPVFFEQPHNRLYLPLELLDRPSTALSAELFPIIAGHLKARIQGPARSKSTSERVRDLLMIHSPDKLPSLDMAARTLGVSRATLIRRLKTIGVSYTDLVNERRLGFARLLLTTSGRSISDIALACGYAEAASFTRAFQRQVGQTPSRWRKHDRLV